MFLRVVAWVLALAFFMREVSATLPPQIFYYATVRDFMPQPCRIGSGSTTANRLNYCPNVTSVQDDVLAGKISGHPDFQRVTVTDNSVTGREYLDSQRLYLPVNAACGPYQSKYALPGKPFPVTRPGAGTKPAVLSDLRSDTTGIPKMQYCYGNEGYACDHNDSLVGASSVMNETTFLQWHQDNPRFNIRAGYRQKLFLNASTSQYGYDSARASNDPITTNFFTPFNDERLGGWPPSIEERRRSGVLNVETEKFWFTTEIHTYFQYRGGEIFYFSGDDDVHVFINNRIALNLGGLHSPLDLTLNVTNFEQELGLVRGRIYQFDLYHAERQVTQSNFALTTTLSSSCNVVTTDFRTNGTDVDNVIDWRVNNLGSTLNSDWVLISGPGFGFIGTNRTAILMAPGFPNVVSYMFHKQPQNVGSGFSFSFKFRINGTGHGFSVLFHDRDLGLKDFNGGTGPNLGIKNTDNSFAIVFDMCPNYPNCVSTTSQVRVHYNDQGNRRNSVSSATRTVYDPTVYQNWQDDKPHVVEVFYYAFPDWLEVYVDNSLRLVERNFSMTRVIGDKDASVGFATSTSVEGSDMSVRIYDVQMKTVKILPRLTLSAEDAQIFPKTFVANGRDFVDFTMLTRDACLNNVTYGGLDDLVKGKLVATSVSDLPVSAGRRLQGGNNTVLTVGSALDGEVVDRNNGQYSVRFRTNSLANFTVYMAFGPNCTWNGTNFTPNVNCWTVSYPNAALSVPFSTFAPTSEDSPSGLGTPALAGIGVAAGITLFCGSIMLFVGVRVRNQWRRDKRFIDEGKKVVAERGVAYTGDNELDMLQNKLQSTLHALNAERAKKLKDQDQQHVIDELLKQKGELQEVVRRMKIIRSGGDPNAQEERLPPIQRFRKSFAASRVSRGASLFNPTAGEASAPNPLFDRLRKSITRPASKSTAVAHLHEINEKANDV